MMMQLNFQALLLLGLPAALLLAGGAQASLYGEDVRYTQCRASINSAPYLFGPPTASAQPISAAPQECSFLFPGRNNYVKGEETVLGSFIAPDCGSCAAACAASYYSVTEQYTIGPFTYMDEVVKELTTSALTDFKAAILNSVETCTVCTDWNYCSPEVAVVTESTSLRQEPGPNGTFYYVPEDPFFGSKCAGRVSGTTGETEPYGYQGYGPDLCLVKSTTGCNNPTSDRQVPPGTCTLKFNPKTEVKEHFPPEQSGIIGWTNFDMWDWVPDGNGDGVWSKSNSLWNGEDDDCPSDTGLPYPTATAEDLAVCPGIDPSAGVFMSGMCEWTPGIAVARDDQDVYSQGAKDIKGGAACQYLQENLDEFKTAMNYWLDDSISLTRSTTTALD